MWIFNQYPISYMLVTFTWVTKLGLYQTCVRREYVIVFKSILSDFYRNNPRINTNLYIYIYIYIYIYMARETWVQSLVESYQLRKKMVLDSTLLYTHHDKVKCFTFTMIKGKVEQSWERSSAIPYTLVY